MRPKLAPHRVDCAVTAITDLLNMPDALAPRFKFGVIAPATNTIVQPEFDAMRPRGVTNQMTRVVIPDTPVGTESEFANMMTQVRASIEAALDDGPGVLARRP